MFKRNSLQEKIFTLRVKAWSLYCDMQAQKVVEKTSKHDKDQIYYQFISSHDKWGGVELSNWLQGAAKICKDRNKSLENVAVFYLPKRNSTDDFKIINLMTIAKRMGLDVTITNNKK